MVPLVPCTHDDVPRLIVKVQYPQICVPVSETDLDDLLKQLREASYYIISLRDFKPYTYIYSITGELLHPLHACFLKLLFYMAIIIFAECERVCGDIASVS